MKIEKSGILLLGADGGIGQVLARQLSETGARLVLAGLNPTALQTLAYELPGPAEAIATDINDPTQREVLLKGATGFLGQVEILINTAGILDFKPFDELSPERIELTLRINALAPMLLIQSVLPSMLAAGHGRIVNVGSIFGSIGFPYFSVYSASKFALHGFSEALRRELADTGVGVTYIAPRATRTPLNNSRVMAMGKATGMNMDAPEKVAQRIIHAISNDVDEAFIGQPESLFARLNGIFPRLVDRGLRRQRQIMEPYAKS